MTNRQNAKGKKDKRQTIRKKQTNNKKKNRQTKTTAT